MDDASTLMEIESLKQLKARYCRLLDAKDWTAWRGIFADDFLSDTSEAGGKVIEGADEFVAFLRKTLGKPSQVTAHQVHAPELELTSDTTARGVWALEDTVIDLQWELDKLTRLRVDFFNGLVAVYVSDRVNRLLKRLPV